jgi:hypothetical protein
VSDQPYQPIPGSYVVQCPSVQSGNDPLAITFSRANIFGFVATSTLGAETLGGIAHAQFDALPAQGLEPTEDSNMWIIVGASVVAFGLVVLFTSRVMRSRKRSKRLLASDQAQPPLVGTPPPGWYPDPADLKRVRFWTGNQWGPSEAHPERADQPLDSPTDQSGTPSASIKFGELSSDGTWFWNGTAWTSSTSADGKMRWTGDNWEPIR